MADQPPLTHSARYATNLSGAAFLLAWFAWATDHVALLPLLGVSVLFALVAIVMWLRILRRAGSD